jgi:soluble lytic murein transglycosylase
MMRIRRAILFGGIWAAFACGKTTDARAAKEGEEVEVAQSAAARLQGDALVRQADSLVRAGRVWRATALLASRLVTPATASPELRLAGARAAAGWDGWAEVDRLLRGAPWLDTQFSGEGRELLVRSELERGQESVADARLALQAARDDGSRVVRRVLLARAYDRANTRDSAAAAYLSAASRLPRIADWLRLRAAGVTGDSAARAALFSHVASAPAKARIPFTDAQARERAGDFTGAARVYQNAGAMGAAFRALALGVRDDPARQVLTQRILAYLGGTPNPAEARQSLDVLDGMKIILSPAQALVLARATAEHGTAARAASAFERAGTLGARDRYAYAGVLMRAGRSPDAVQQYASLAGDSGLAGLAAYQRARAMLQAGDGAGSRAALRAAAAQYATNSAVGAPALLLLADLQVDDGDIAGAARSLAELTSRYPNASQAPLARFRSGLIAWSTNPAAAAAQFDSLVARYPNDDDAMAARYWAARARERLGQQPDAARRWHEIITTAPLSYYAALSAARLKVSAWTAPPGPDTTQHVASVDSAMSREAILDRLGMDVESRFELDALEDRAEHAPNDAPAIAQALVQAGEQARGLHVATHALEKTPSSRVLLRAAYPLARDDALVEESRKNNLDPALVAGLIRQESSWNPRAVSPAGARGLMQLMPAVGASIAAAHHYPLWNQGLLFEPDVSLELGTSHLATSLRRDTPPARALAAYNAGASRVARWTQRPGSADPELFAEWIPFDETRDYVRVVQRNAGIYRALYGLGE